MGVYDELKKANVDFNKIIEKESKLLDKSFYFRKLTGSEWRIIDALKTQLAHGILNQKLTIEEANASNYVFDLIRFSWVNDFTGTQVIDSKERFEGLANGEIDPYIVNEISRLALEANDFILTEESIESKKNYLNLN
jgi:hypothetical protein